MLEMLNAVKHAKSGPEKTISLLKLDGTDEMATASQIKDSANPSRIWTLSSGSTLSTEKVKFGTKAFKISGGNGLITPHDPVMFSETAWTMEMFVNIWDYAVFNFFMSKTSGTVQNPFMRQYGNNKYIETVWDAGGGGSGNSNSLFVTGNWAHIALVVNGNVKNVYLNGILVKTENSTYTWGKGAYPFVIGSNNRRATTDVQGRFYAQAFRLSKGVRYSGNFTPPTSMFTID
jgi:hypothetical protein